MIVSNPWRPRVRFSRVGTPRPPPYATRFVGYAVSRGGVLPLMLAALVVGVFGGGEREGRGRDCEPCEPCETNRANRNQSKPNRGFHVFGFDDF